MEFGALVPEIYVSDYRKSLDFYTEAIGFKIEYVRTNPLFALLSLGKAQLMIQQIEPTDQHTGPLEAPYGRGINFEITVDDVDTLMLEPTDFLRKTGETESSSRELRVLDPDGYYLRFSQPT